MDISTFCLACHGSRHFPLAFHVYFSCSSKEPMSSSCHLYTAHPADSKQVSSAIYPKIKKRPWFWCDLLTLLTMLHQWFTCVHLLDTYLANFTEGFQLSFTTHQFPSEQHKVVCNQHLHAECGGSATISLEVTTEIYQI